MCERQDGEPLEDQGAPTGAAPCLSSSRSEPSPDSMACHGLQKGQPYVLVPSPRPANRAIHGRWHFLDGGITESWTCPALLPVNAIALPKPKYCYFPQFPRVLPDSPGTPSPKI